MSTTVTWDEAKASVDSNYLDAWDFVTPTHNLSLPPRFADTNTNMVDVGNLPWEVNESFALTPTAHSQMLGRIKFPERFWNHLGYHGLYSKRESIANDLLVDHDSVAMVRQTGGCVFGLMSPCYERIGHDFVMDVLGNAKISDRFDLKSFKHKKDYMNLKFTTKVENVGDYGVGFSLTNSESGLSRFRMSTYIFVLACSNGMIANKGEVGTQISMIHKGAKVHMGMLEPPRWANSKFKVLRSQIEKNIALAEDESLLLSITETIDRAKRTTVADADQHFESISVMLKLSEEEKKAYNDSLKTHWATSGEGEAQNSLWGSVQALTFVAHTNPIFSSSFRQEEIESEAWNILVGG